MSNDIHDFNEKLKKARGQDDASIAKKVEEEKIAESKQGIQAGVELVGAIFIPTAIGYGLDQWLDTKPAFMLILFFLGICTGFYNVYRITQNMGTAVGNKIPEKTPEKVEENGLHHSEKDSKTSSDNKD